MSIKNIYLIFLIGFLASNCQPELKENKNKENSFIEYSFFVAGHTYGNPMTYQYGLHPPFVKQINYLNNYPKLNLGFFTGDVVPKPTPNYWDSARAHINQFKVPIHIAAGNHDRGKVFDSLYTSYYSFINHNDLFIILSPTNWNIKEKQLTFLKNCLKTNAKMVNNIFIFTHELIWWSPQNQFKDIVINYLPHYPGKSNFEQDILPILKQYKNNITLFAGDLGCTSVVSAYSYYKSKNITYIASGMGNNKNDNFIMVDVDTLGNPHYKILGINSNLPYEIENIDKYKSINFLHLLK